MLFIVTLLDSLLCLMIFLSAAKYDVAISTACSGLDYIVVETTGAAQACVELLRKKSLGVSTFMILVLTMYYSDTQHIYPVYITLNY